MSTDTETVALPVEYLDVKPADIAQHPDNPRHDVGDITDITASAKDRGILEPLIVALPYEGMKSIGKASYLLIAGHRRLAAAKKARLKTVPVIVRHDWTTRGDQVSAMMIENLHRRDLTPIEEGEGYQLLIDVEGLTQAKAADRVQQSPKRVRDRLKLVKLPKGVQARIHEGQITLTEAVEAAAFAGNDKVMTRLEKAAGTNNFAVELATAKSERKAEQDWNSLLKQITDAGYTQLEGPVHARPDNARPTQDLPGLYSYAWDNAGKWAAEKRVHLDCPHRAFIVTLAPSAAGNRVTFMCTNPAVHTPATAAARDVVDTRLPETPEERAAREAEAAEREAREQAAAELHTKLDAAATVRRDHVAGILHHPTGDADLAKRLLIDQHRHDWNPEATLTSEAGYTWPVIAAWLRLDPDLDPHGDREEAVGDKLERLSLPALAIATALLRYTSEERNLASTHAHYPPDTDEAIEWIHHLTDNLAYPWSDFEREHFGLDADGHVPAPVDDESGEGDA